MSSSPTSVVVVGYVPNPRGQAALGHALAECRRRGARLVVVNNSRGDALVDEDPAGDDGDGTGDEPDAVEG